MNDPLSMPEPALGPAWVTIGSFDGVHRGHQEIIRRLVQGAHANQAAAVVVTFFPHPASVLRGLHGPFYLSDPEERAARLIQLGADSVLTLQFDKQLAAMSAEDFMRSLNQRMELRRLLIGYDFALGKGRQGDVPFLTRLGEQMGYQVEVLPPVENGGEVVSSSRIRTALNQGQVGLASELLGRPYSLSGTVVHGDGRGHGLGIPTANLHIWAERLVPAVGVYAVYGRVNGRRVPGVTNIGVRPTFESEAGLARVETHLLDFEGDLYGQPLELEFIEYLRPEQRFPSVLELLEQIHADIRRAREVLKHAD